MLFRSINNEKPKFEHNWQNLYYDELVKHIDDSATMFNLYDLDKDGTPELLLSEAPYHAARGDFYTANPDRLSHLGSYGCDECQYTPEYNHIHVCSLHMGVTHLLVSSRGNSETTVVITYYFRNDSLPGTYKTYSFDIREDLIVRKYDITQSNIESVLKQY